MKTIPLWGLAMFALAAAPVLADEGRIPLYQPTVITQSGDYVVTRDIASPTTPVIRIAAPDVTIDLHNHSLTSADTSQPIIDVQGGSNVTLRDGRLSGGAYGIFESGGTSTGVTRIANVLIERANAEGISLNGVAFVEVSGCVLRNNNQLGAAPASLSVDYDLTVYTSFSGRFTRNRIETGTTVLSAMILEGLHDGAVTDNSITGSGGGIDLVQPSAAIGCGGNLIARNDVRGVNSGEGLQVDVACDDNRIEANTFSAMGHGILLNSSDNLVVENVANGCYYSGVFIGGARNLVARNQIDRNSGDGIYFASGSTGNAYRDNILRGNVPAAVGGPALASNTDAGGNVP
jgi:parallel beta-helix repeat protein